VWIVIGFFKPSKSSGPPSQKVKYLGLIIDSNRMTFGIPDYKLLRLLEEARFLIDFCKISVTSLAS
jgi:hypothetical protein